MTGQQAFERYIANAQRLDPKWDGWTRWDQATLHAQTAWNLWAEGKISNVQLGVSRRECLPSRDLTWKLLEEILGQVG